jgi:hypothetical protein
LPKFFKKKQLKEWWSNLKGKKYRWMKSQTKSILKTISNKKNSNKKMNTKSDTWKKLKKDEIEKKSNLINQFI